MTDRRVHVLYEFGADLRPHGSAFLRLLRPLSHPVAGAGLDVSFDRVYDGQAADVVIVDRFWRPWDISLAGAHALVGAIRARGVRLVYALDDDLLDPARVPEATHRDVVEFWLREADGVVVTTSSLRERFLALNERIAVVPNALDERLLPGGIREDGQREDSAPLVIGYMGTLTHDDDLAMIAPALNEIGRRHGDAVALEIVGVVGRTDTLAALDGLPVRLVSPLPGEAEYPLFMVWLTHTLRWDIALAPLVDTPFNACKSDLKHLDYAAMGVPGVYSRVPAYTGTVRHGETGLLCENDPAAWVETLEALIASPRLRRRIARSAAEYLYRERILARCGARWATALKEVLR